MRIFKQYEMLVPNLGEMEDREQKMIRQVAEKTAQDLILLGDKPILVEFREQNLAEADASWEMLLLRAADGEIHAAAAETTGQDSMIFETMATQKYQAKNSTNAKEDYCGQITIKVKLRGVYDKTKECFTQNDALALVAIRLSLAHYCEEILRFYPEWTTDYRDAPKFVSMPSEHL